MLDGGSFCCMSKKFKEAHVEWESLLIIGCLGLMDTQWKPEANRYYGVFEDHTDGVGGDSAIITS